MTIINIVDDWNDWHAMRANIIEHAKNNGNAVIVEDRPQELRLGYRCTNTNKTWSITLANVRAWRNKS